MRPPAGPMTFWLIWRAAIFRVVDLPVTAAIFALLVFVIDTATPIDSAVAVLYVVVVMAAPRFSGRRGLLQTLISYMLTHAFMPLGTALLRCMVSMAAIVITTLMALKNQSATTVLEEQARMLNLMARGRGLPVIFITAFPEDHVRRRALGAGAVCLLSKPFSGEILMQHLRAALP